MEVEDGETLRVPEVALPVEKPPPVQEVAFEELQVSVEEPPDAIVVGLAERLAVGAGSPPGGGLQSSTPAYPLPQES